MSAPRKGLSIAIVINAAVAVGVVAILTLVLTGVWGGDGQLPSVPSGRYRINSANDTNEYGYAIEFNDSGWMTSSPESR